MYNSICKQIHKVNIIFVHKQTKPIINNSISILCTFAHTFPVVLKVYMVCYIHILVISSTSCIEPLLDIWFQLTFSSDVDILKCYLSGGYYYMAHWYYYIMLCYVHDVH